jgi:hypothetical protein
VPTAPPRRVTIPNIAHYVGGVETPPWGVSAPWVRQRADQAAPILDGRHSCMPTARACSAWASLNC